MHYLPTDFSQVTTYPLAERRNKMEMSRDAAGPVTAGMSVASLDRKSTRLNSSHRL